MPHVDFAQSFCRGAIARRDITPPVGIYHRMWGAATHERATGIHRPLLATALAMASTATAVCGDDGQSLYVVVALDRADHRRVAQQHRPRHVLDALDIGPRRRLVLRL